MGRSTVVRHNETSVASPSTKYIHMYTCTMYRTHCCLLNACRLHSYNHPRQDFPPPMSHLASSSFLLPVAGISFLHDGTWSSLLSPGGFAFRSSLLFFLVSLCLQFFMIFSPLREKHSQLTNSSKRKGFPLLFFSLARLVQIWRNWMHSFDDKVKKKLTPNFGSLSAKIQYTCKPLPTIRNFMSG